MKALLFSLLLLFGTVFNTYSQDDKLKKAKQSIKKESSTGKQPNSTTTATSRAFDNSNLDKPFDNLFTAIAYNLTYGLVVESIFEKNSNMHFASLSDYPYKKSEYGNYTYTANSEDYSMTRLDIATNFVYESSALYGNDLDLKFRFAKRFSLELNYLQLFEKNPSNLESFSIISAMANYHRIRAQKLDFWFGLGTMYVANDVKEYGFAYGLGAEWFIKKPISIYASHKGTSINQKLIDKSKILIKYYIKNYTISTGYEYYRLGVSNINAFSIGFGISL